MWITKVSINNPVFATMVMVGLCVLGLFSYGKLGVEQLPDITIPVVSISVIYPGASPEAVENDITKPIENAVNAVAGIKTLRSSSFEGDSETSIEFKVGTNVDRVIQEVRDKVAQVRPTFPREAKEPLIARADTENAQPVVQLAVTSTTRDLKELSTLTDQVIVKELHRRGTRGR
jgi:HAE1 family hydrophobic/amphiphilic exporter-1